MLLGKGREEDYIDFLNVRKIPLVREAYIDHNLAPDETGPITLDPAAVDLMETIRTILKTDRELHDKAAKAFVSALRAYSKHEATFIFRLADLDMHSAAISFGLLRMPAMPEIKDWRKRKEALRKRGPLEGEAAEEDIPWEDAELDVSSLLIAHRIIRLTPAIQWDTFAYVSKTREAARLQALEEKKSAPAPSESDRAKRRIKAEMREAWSVQKDRKGRREERREKRDAKKKWEWEKEQAEGEGREVSMVESFKRKKRAELDSDQEEDQKEYKALKREVQEEKMSKQGGKKEKVVGGAFDDLD